MYRDDLDNVVGMLHVTDLLRALAAGDGGVNAGALAREVLTVPETLGADDLLAEMRRRRAREALVIDEYGGTAGLVTFESLMERIVGEIPGESGAQARVVVRPDGSADIDGLALVTDVNEQFGLDIDEETYTTIGGYVLGRLGRRARVGDTIDVDGRKMRVEAVDGMRVAKVWLSKPAAAGARRRMTRSATGHGAGLSGRAVLSWRSDGDRRQTTAQSARSSRSAFAMTITDAPVSATMAIQSVATPATAATTNAAFSTTEMARFIRMFRTVARLRRNA